MTIGLAADRSPEDDRSVVRTAPHSLFPTAAADATSSACDAEKSANRQQAAASTRASGQLTLNRESSLEAAGGRAL